MITARVTKANAGRLEKLGSEAAGRDGEGLACCASMIYGGGRRIVKRMLRYGFVFYIKYYRIVFCLLLYNIIILYIPKQKYLTMHLQTYVPRLYLYKSIKVV